MKKKLNENKFSVFLIIIKSSKILKENIFKKINKQHKKRCCIRILFKNTKNCFELNLLIKNIQIHEIIIIMLL